MLKYDELRLYNILTRIILSAHTLSRSKKRRDCSRLKVSRKIWRVEFANTILQAICLVLPIEIAGTYFMKVCGVSPGSKLPVAAKPSSNMTNWVLSATNPSRTVDLYITGSLLAYKCTAWPAEDQPVKVHLQRVDYKTRLPRSGTSKTLKTS